MLQNVNLTMELGVGIDGAGFAQNLTTFDVSSLNTTEQSTDVIASLSVVQNLTEHFDTGYNGLHLLFLQTNDLNFIASLQTDHALHDR